MVDHTDEELLEALGVDLDAKPKSSRSALEERVIAGFEDIERFFEENGRLPMHGEDRDIFERIYAVRLEQIRNSTECRAILAGLDKHGILTNLPEPSKADAEIDDEELLAELGVLESSENDITVLTHVKPRSEIQVAEEIAKRQPCRDFDTFKPLFAQARQDMAEGLRQTTEFKENAQIDAGDFFILSGQMAYVAEVGEEIKAPNGATDARLRVIYDNGTESNLLMRSLQRALYKDETGRRILPIPSAGPLFSDTVEEDDLVSGTIYVLRSLSDDPFIKEHREVIHKIGVTGGDIQRRIANAKMDPTFLMADVEVVASYKLANINRVKLENLIHRFFEPAKLEIVLKDRFGNPIVPREWFLVPLNIIDEVVNRIKKGNLPNYTYNLKIGKIEAI
ncbi:MAG: GIY-YIG nuclease family protein [Bacteroidetes bacterium]|nr:GIY-YIG nuclease family protein [Bacteroidota bacterium]